MSANTRAVKGGRIFRSDGTIANEADGINDDGSRNVKLTGSNMQNGDSIPVAMQGANAELASAKHTEMFATVKTYTRAEGASQMEIYVETGYVRIRTDGEACTEDTGEPLGAGFGMAWRVPSISVYFADDATVTVVSR